MDSKNTAASSPDSSDYPSAYERVVGNGFDYTVEAPTLDPQRLLSEPIYRVHSAEDSLLSQRFSQTPLLPSQLFELGMLKYDRAVFMELDRRLHGIAERVNLAYDFAPHAYYLDAIQRETAVELQKRITSNSIAGQRLIDYFASNPELLNENDAQLIWRARTGDATMAEAGDLLLRYPVIGSIEAMKHTAPLQLNEKSASEIFINQHLDEFKAELSNPSRIHITDYPEGDPRRRRHSLPHTGITGVRKGMPELIHGEKESLAEVTNGTTTIELIKKQTYIVLPEDLFLMHSVRNIYGSYNQSGEKITVNLQPIATTAYWRVKPTVDEVLQ